jgi:hypothetical protein
VLKKGGMAVIQGRTARLRQIQPGSSSLSLWRGRMNQGNKTLVRSLIDPGSNQADLLHCQRFGQRSAVRPESRGHVFIRYILLNSQA